MLHLEYKIHSCCLFYTQISTIIFAVLKCINYIEATSIHIDITWYKINVSSKEEVMVACMWKHHASEVCKGLYQRSWH